MDNPDALPVPSKEEVADFMAANLHLLLDLEVWKARYEWDEGRGWRVMLPGDPGYDQARYEMITIDSEGKRVYG